jgi:hypothetical protein
MLKGDGNGVTAEYLATQPTRLQAAVMFLRLKGLEEDAMAWDGTENFADADQVAWEGGRTIMAYLFAHKELGWVGDAGNFNPAGLMTAQAYYKVMLETLGYKQNTADVIGDFTWAGVVNFAADLGLKEVAGVETFTVNDLATATVEALVTPVKDSEASLAEVLVEMGVVEEAVAIEAGVVLDPVEVAVLAAEMAIGELPTEITLEDMEAVLVADELVAAALELDENAVIENLEVLEAALVTLEELQTAENTLLEAVAAAEEAIAALPATITAAEVAAVAAARELVAAAQELGAEEIAGLDTLVSAEAKVVELENAPAVVESVTATNLIELVVTFDKAIDEDTVIAANFKIGTGVNATTPVLNEDGKTVTVTVNALDAALVQPANYTLTVNNVKDVNGNTVVKTEKAVRVFDNALPTITGIALTGPNTFVITFNEPIKTAGTVKINNGIYGVGAPTIDGNEVTIQLSASSLPEGNYTVVVSAYKDYAGFSIDSTTLTLAYAKDATVPVATVKSAKQTEVVVEFDRAVTLNSTFDNINTVGADPYEDYFYHTFSTWAPDSVTASVDKKTYTLEFTTYPIPEGASTLVVKYKGSATDSEIKDAWGNKWSANTNFALAITADKTAPTVTNVKVTNEKTVELYFSEDMDQTKAEDEANFIVKDVDGKVVTTPAFTNAYTENAGTGVYKITMTFATNLTGGNYTVEVKGQEDEALLPNTLPTAVLPFVVTDLTAIDPDTNADDVKIAAIESLAADTADVIYVTFAEKMATEGQYSVLSAANYLLSGAALPEGTTLSLFGSTGRVVKISIANGSTQSVVGETLTIGRVADLAGNAMVALSYGEGILAEGVAAVTAVRQTDANKATIIVDKPLTVVLASGFTAGTGADKRTVASIDSWTINTAGETVINVTLDAHNVTVTSPADTSELIANFDIVADILVSETGVKMAIQDCSGLIDDFRAPKFNDLTFLNDVNSTITIEFTEALAAANQALYAHDLIVKDDEGTTLVAGLDYTTTVVGGDLVITVTGVADVTNFTVETKSTVNYMVDANDNKVVVFTAKKAE